MILLKDSFEATDHNNVSIYIYPFTAMYHAPTIISFVNTFERIDTLKDADLR